jgi:hypothetical protein
METWNRNFVLLGVSPMIWRRLLLRNDQSIPDVHLR